MIFYRLKTTLRNHSPSPAKLASVISLALILLSWPLPIFFNGMQMQFFGIPFIYFYIILVSPLLILFITSWAVNFADKLDRNQLETENE
jgi:hypothetical protein